MSREQFRFDGRVAIVTGAGRGIGRAHAQLLAARGASVVVNDFGGTKEGAGFDPDPAHAVVAEIEAAGGVAAADTHDVSDPSGCEAIVAAAIEEFGRVDIVVNNAGNSWFGTFPDVPTENLDRTWAIHVGGAWHVTRAAWPHMVAQGFGRVMLTTSTGMLGLADNLSYATVKGALIGMMRSLSIAGAAHGITVNCLAPSAAVRRGTGTSTVAGAIADTAGMETELVPPLMAYLAHESCDVTGEIYLSGIRRFARMFIGVTEGYVDTGSALPTPEDVAEHWPTINDESGAYVPRSLFEWMERYMAHRPVAG